MQGKIYLDVRKGQQLKSGAYPLRVELTGNGIFANSVSTGIFANEHFTNDEHTRSIICQVH